MSEPKKETQIKMALTCMEEEIDIFDKNVARLVSELSPVLHTPVLRTPELRTPEPKSAKKEDSVSQEICELAKVIYDSVSRINSLNQRIMSTILRLEI